MIDKLGKVSSVITIAFAFISAFTFGYSWATIALIVICILFIIYEFTGERSICSTVIFFVLIILVGLVTVTVNKKPESIAVVDKTSQQPNASNKKPEYPYIYEIQPVLPEKEELQFFKVSITEPDQKEECKIEKTDSNAVISCKRTHSPPLNYRISGGCNVIKNEEAYLGEFANPILLCH